MIFPAQILTLRIKLRGGAVVARWAHIRQLADGGSNSSLKNILRGGAVVARWAHNPKVGGSNPPSATSQKPWCECTGAFLFAARTELARVRDEKQKSPEPRAAWRGF